MKAYHLNLAAFFVWILFLQVNFAQAVCYPEIEFIKTAAPGEYHRVHPSGDFVLYTNPTGARAEIIDLRSKDSSGKVIPNTIKTAMTNETYPVEGSWDLLTSPRSGTFQTGMSFYQFSEFLQNSKSSENVKPIYFDSKHNDFYHSAAQLPGQSDQDYVFRVTLWKNRWTQDYIATRNNGSTAIQPKGPRYQICNNIFKDDSVALLNQPILSKDGTMIAGVPSFKATTHVYRIKENKDCELIKDIGVLTGKVNFNYAKSGELPKIAYLAEGTAENQYKKGIYIYDLKTDKNYLISGDNEAAAYPGFTEDGRIVYAGFANGNRGTENTRYHGVFRVDTLKLMSNGKYCTEVSSTKKSETNIKKPAAETKTNN